MNKNVSAISHLSDRYILIVKKLVQTFATKFIEDLATKSDMLFQDIDGYLEG